MAILSVGRQLSLCSPTGTCEGTVSWFLKIVGSFAGSFSDRQLHWCVTMCKCMFSIKSYKRPKTHFFNALEKLQDIDAWLCASRLGMKIPTFLVPGLINSPYSIGVKVL